MAVLSSANLSGKWVVLRELLAAWRYEDGADNRGK